jgi:hypothetical protein
MLGLLFLGGLALAIAVLWNEPRWAILTVATLILGAITAALSWMVMGSVQPGDPEIVVEMFAALIAPYVFLFLLFVVVGVGVVIFRGAYLRAKQRRDDADTEAELARIRQSR